MFDDVVNKGTVLRQADMSYLFHSMSVNTPKRKKRCSRSITQTVRVASTLITAT
jgi:hypothetical protein